MLCFCSCSGIRERDDGNRMQKLDYAKMGMRIRQFRKAKGWSQEVLARKCEISMNFMGNIERGTRKMSMDTFASLCMELGADADTLLWGRVKPSETAIQSMWGKQEKIGEDSYSMYVQIMKSVAEIMNEA